VSGSPILWDVDTQADFIRATGKLAIPGAEAAIEAMGRVVAWAREQGITHVASLDDHELTDPEISFTPDWVSTFPPHCLRGTPGGHKIPETQQEDPLPLSHVAIPPLLLRGLLEGHREILLLKKSVDVFTNPNAGTMLEILDPSEVIVFGVATDICDDEAITALLHRGRRVAFVEDAASGLDEARTAACLERWRAQGVRFTTSECLAAGLD
jgi:nicotinamidase/pyrazinamidase